MVEAKLSSAGPAWRNETWTGENASPLTSLLSAVAAAIAISVVMISPRRSVNAVGTVIQLLFENRETLKFATLVTTLPYRSTHLKEPPRLIADLKPRPKAP